MNIMKVVNIQHTLSLFPKFTVILQISKRCYQRYYYPRKCNAHSTRATTTAMMANAKTCYVTTTITHYLVYQTTTITTITNKYLSNKIKYFYLLSTYCSCSTILLLNNYVGASKLNVVLHRNNAKYLPTSLVSISLTNLFKMWKFATRTFKDAFGSGGCNTGGVTSHCRCTLNNIFNNDEQQLLLQTTTCGENNTSDDNEIDSLVINDGSQNINNKFNYCLYKNLYKISFKCSNTLQSLGWYVNNFLSLQQNDFSINKQLKQLKPTTPSINKQLIFDTNNYKKIDIISDKRLTSILPKTVITKALNPQVIDTFQLKDIKTINENTASIKNNSVSYSISTTSDSESKIHLKTTNIVKDDNSLKTLHKELSENTNNATNQTAPQTKNKNEQAIEDAAARFAIVTGVLENQLGAAYLKQQRTTNNTNLDIALEHFEAGTLYKNASAAFNLGLCYELGIGTKQNYQNAAKCYKVAIELGEHTKAMYNLAIYYIKGLGDLPQDFNLAYQLFINAAQKGHAQSIQALHSVQEYNDKNDSTPNNVSQQQQQALSTC